MLPEEESMKRTALALLVLAACGGDDGGTTPQMDAPMNTNKVQSVTCPTTADATVMTTNTVDAYMPMATTVPKNAVVKFVMSSFHNAAPNTVTTTDPGLVVGFGETKCLKFTETGTFGFFCSTHSFAGTITVQ
jgi:plastocyanin